MGIFEEKGKNSKDPNTLKELKKPLNEIKRNIKEPEEGIIILEYNIKSYKYNNE